MLRRLTISALHRAALACLSTAYWLEFRTAPPRWEPTLIEADDGVVY